MSVNESDTMHPFDALEAPLDSINLVEASAGTGKTYNITAVYIRALVELSLEIDRVLVVTYTEAATQELKERLLERITDAVNVLEGEFVDDPFLNDYQKKLQAQGLQAVNNARELLERALRRFDDAAVFTIHGFCNRSLQDQAFESGASYDTEFLSDQNDLLQEVMDDCWRELIEDFSGDEPDRHFIDFLLEHNYSPDALLQQLRGAVGKPYLNILPDESSFSRQAFRRSFELLQEHFREIQQLWKATREDLLDMLLAEGMNKNKYRNTTVRNIARNLDDWTTQPFTPFSSIPKFEKLFPENLADGTKKDHPAPEHPFFAICKAWQETADALQVDLGGFKRWMLEELRRRARTRKEELGVLSYDDLLLNMQRALQDNPAAKSFAATLRRQYPVALIDEFQDTDPIQYDIFKAIYQEAEEGCMYMIGDPKQSIYSFRGADVFAYLRARNDAPPERRLTLTHNYRSSEPLIEAVNAFYEFAGSEAPSAFLDKDIPYRRVQAGKKDKGRCVVEGESDVPLQIRVYGDEVEGKKNHQQESVAEETASHIARLIALGRDRKATIEGEGMKARDIAVLVRTHKEAGMIQQALNRYGVKSVQYSEQSVFESTEAQDMQYLMQALSEPGNGRRVRAALTSRLLGKDAKAIYDLEQDEEEWAGLLNQFRDWHDLWQQRGFTAMFSDLMRRQEVGRRLAAQEQGERALTNILHLAELIQREERKRGAGIRGLVKWIAQKRSGHLQKQDDEQLRLESDEELVQIVTMHRSKGLEYPVVFCPFLWTRNQIKDSNEPVFFHDKGRACVNLHEKGALPEQRENHRLFSLQEDLAESLRLAYVAITRAEYRCYVACNVTQGTEFTPLGYYLLGHKRVLELMQHKVGPGSYSRQVKPDKEEFSSGLARLESECEGRLGFIRESFAELTGREGQDDEYDPKVRTFKREEPLEPAWTISSFSRLVQGAHGPAEQPDHDREYFSGAFEEPAVKDTHELTVFSFPRGARAGTCLHKIFEDIDFSRPDNQGEIISEALDLYGFDSKWLPVAQKLVKRVLQTPLDRQLLQLRRITRDETLKEMQFYYPLNNISRNRLYRLAGLPDPGQPAGGFVDSSLSGGYMTGFVDLIFRYEGRYYIADYKSNHLGDAPSDYGPEQLELEMREAQYDLQYHIYSVALHRYLRQRLKEYDYDQHFGGVYYLFVRGMEPGSKNGIYFDRPDRRRIAELDEYLQNGGSV